MRLAYFSLFSLLSLCSLGAAATVFDDCGNSWKSQPLPAPTVLQPPSETACLSFDCEMFCDGSGNTLGGQHPTLDPVCKFGAPGAPLSADILGWIHDTSLLDCPPVAPGTVAVFPVPVAIACPATSCGTNDPNLLPPDCAMTCTTPGAAPIPHACPSELDNSAMVLFLNDVMGYICNDIADTNPYDLEPDSSLVDTSVCARRGRRGKTREKPGAHPFRYRGQ